MMEFLFILSLLVGDFIMKKLILVLLFALSLSACKGIYNDDSPPVSGSCSLVRSEVLYTFDYPFADSGHWCNLSALGNRVTIWQYKGVFCIRDGGDYYCISRDVAVTSSGEHVVPYQFLCDNPNTYLILL